MYVCMYVCRSKYCTHLGFVVARFDHYCIWLNNSIGFGNHRTFMLFLLAHLLTALLTVALLVRCRDNLTA